MSFNPLINNKGFQSYAPLLLSLSIHGIILLTFTMMTKLYSFPLGGQVGEAIEMTVAPPQAATTAKPSTTAVVAKPNPVIPSPPTLKPTPSSPNNEAITPITNNEIATPTPQVTSTNGPPMEDQEEQSSSTKAPSQQLVAQKEEKSIEDELNESEAFPSGSELTDFPNKPNPSTNNESSSAQTNIPVQDGRLLEQAPGNSPLSYPPQLRLKNITGSLVLSYSVTTLGQVIQMKILRSSGYKEFDQEAAQKIATWRYKGGQEGAVIHPVFFKLSYFAR